MRLFSTPLLAIAALILSVSVHAQQQTAAVPRLIRFNGSYHAVNQQAQIGAIVATFTIYRDESAWTPLWSEAQSIQPDKDGNYSVLLGSTRGEGMPADLFVTGDPRWLEVEVNQEKQPRLLLASVPYALRASDADTLGGLPASAYLRAANPVVAAVTVTDSTAANAANAASARLAPRISSGTPNCIGMFSNTTDLVCSSMVQGTYQNNPAVSIGGSGVLGAMTLIGNVPSGDAAGMALYNAGGGAGASVSLDMYNTYANGGIPQAKIKALDDGNYSDHLTFWTKTPGGPKNPVTEQVRITSTGNVGIGTTSPLQKLEVNGNVMVDGNISLSGSIQSGGTPLLYAPNDALGNFGAGYGALQSITPLVGPYPQASGTSNTAVGGIALRSNTSGYSNTAVGYFALGGNTTGLQNTAMGQAALQSTTTGGGNTAVGFGALDENSTGQLNTALGYQAGATCFSLGTGSFNIYIGPVSCGPSDNGVVRIGDPVKQTTAFIAGIRGVTTASNNAIPVYIDSNGQLGTVSSSRRFKKDIQDMGDATADLMRLRPVTYRYKQPFADGSEPIQYGLIAEEVAEVYPDLVAHSADGQIETVKYQVLDSMLLNEVQRLHAVNAAQQDKIEKLEERLSRLESALDHPKTVTATPLLSTNPAASTLPAAADRPADQ
jgi:hypothetical protein